MTVVIACDVCGATVHRREWSRIDLCLEEGHSTYVLCDEHARQLFEWMAETRSESTEQRTEREASS